MIFSTFSSLLVYPRDKSNEEEWYTHKKECHSSGTKMLETEKKNCSVEILLIYTIQVTDATIITYMYIYAHVKWKMRGLSYRKKHFFVSFLHSCHLHQT